MSENDNVRLCMRDAQTRANYIEAGFIRSDVFAPPPFAETYLTARGCLRIDRAGREAALIHIEAYKARPYLYAANMLGRIRP